MGKTSGRDRRQDVARDKEGRIAASEYRREDIRTLPQWNRLRDIAEEMMLDERLATQRGKLFYAKQITSAQFEVANRWAEMLAEYDRVKLGAYRSAKSPSFEVRSPGEPSAILTEKDAAFLERFTKAHDALVIGGMLVENAVNRLCRNEGVGTLLPQACRGLDILAAHYGLTAGKKRA